MKPTYEELELQLEESQREFRAADATIHNLELKITDMAVQLANAESKCRELAAELSAVDKIHNEAVFITDDHYEQCPSEVQKMIRSLAVLQIPAYQAFLAEVVAQAEGHCPRLQEQDINALMRFNETCEDGEGYDIGAEAMARLVEIGLAGKGPHGIRSITPFGQWVINAREGEVDLEPLKTEEDNIAESALRMAQLRKGAAL